MTTATTRKAPKSHGALAWASDNAPTYCEGVEALYSWSSNHDGYEPFRKFLDLIGYTIDHYDTTFGDWKDPSKSLGYMEIGRLADALTEYANRPQDVTRFIRELIEVEIEHGR